VTEVDIVRHISLTGQAERQADRADTGKRHVRTASLAEQLGADDTIAAPAPGGSPVSFVAIREELARSRRSSGGRPGLADTDRKKIPVTDAVWRSSRRSPPIWQSRASGRPPAR
jgi:hypothetical protein